MAHFARLAARSLFADRNLDNDGRSTSPDILEMGTLFRRMFCIVLPYHSPK